MATFKDIDPGFRRLVSLKNGITIKEGIDAISQYIQNIILTQRGEKLFDPDYGTDIADYTEESTNNLNALEIKDIIYNSLSNDLENLIITPQDIEVISNNDEEKYDITISYKQSSISEKESISFDIKITR